jgi:hypothetical protein
VQFEFLEAHGRDLNGWIAICQELSSEGMAQFSAEFVAQLVEILLPILTGDGLSIETSGPLVDALNEMLVRYRDPMMTLLDPLSKLSHAQAATSKT